MLLTNDFIYPQMLTGYVRQALADYNQNRFTLSQWLPNEMVDDIDYRFASGSSGLARATVFRTYDAESPIGRRVGLNRVTGELPPLSQKLRLGEYDRLRLRKVVDQKITDAILNDARATTLAVAARMEMARGDALVNGSVTLAENGVTATVNYGRAGAMTVTAAILWSTTATSDPIQDLETWRQAYVNLNGAEPGAIVMSRTTLSLLRRSANVRNNIFPGANQPAFVTQSAINDVVAAFGLPPIYIYYAQVDVAGTQTPVLPANKVLLLPAPVADDGSPDSAPDTDLGATFWGTTAESLEPGYGLEDGDYPGIVAGTYYDQDPVALWTKSAAIGLPVLANPNLSMVATVA